nr:hypothetical protein [Tanacetum cinerariifolium]
MHAYYAEKSPIPPPIITPPTSMPNPQEFSLPEEFSSPKKQGHDQSSSSTSTLPQAIKIGESSLQRMPPKNISTSEAPAMTQAAIRQLAIDSVATTLEHKQQTWKMLNANRNPEPRVAHVPRKCCYKEFMSCQPFNFRGIDKLMPHYAVKFRETPEAFIEGLPQSMAGIVTASKPQTLEKSINIA